MVIKNEAQKTMKSFELLTKKEMDRIQGATIRPLYVHYCSCGRKCVGRCKNNWWF